MQNRIYYYNQITSNTIIIDYIYQFYKLEPDYKMILHRINRVRMYKGLLLLFKIIEVDRMQTVNAYHNNEEMSAVKWKFIENTIKPNNKGLLILESIQKMASND